MSLVAATLALYCLPQAQPKVGRASVDYTSAGKVLHGRGYRFTVPNDWLLFDAHHNAWEKDAKGTKTQMMMAGAAAMAARDSSNEFMGSRGNDINNPKFINFESKWNPGPEGTSEEMGDAIAPMLKDMADRFSRSKVTFGGVPFARFSYHQKTWPVSDFVSYYAQLGNDTQYLIGFSSFKMPVVQLEKLSDQIMSTFRLEKPAPTRKNKRAR